MTRPAPLVTEDNQAFWEAAREGRLVAQRCGACGRLRHPPRPMCPACRSLEREIVTLSGTGSVYSYSLLHRPQHPRFTYPLAAVLVELDEGIRLVSNLVGVQPQDVRVGLSVRATFVETDDDMALPVFEPAGFEPAEVTR
jgi:uncharacterized OB-fold protein